MWVNLSLPRRVRPSRPAENVPLQDTSHASQTIKTGVSETPTPVVGITTEQLPQPATECSACNDHDRTGCRRRRLPSADIAGC